MFNNVPKIPNLVNGRVALYFLLQIIFFLSNCSSLEEKGKMLF